MKKIITLVLIAIIALSSAIAVEADNVDAYIIPLTSGIYDDIDALYLISGKSIPSTSRPWSYSEAELIFSKLDSEVIGDTLYSAVKAELESYSDKTRPVVVFSPGATSFGMFKNEFDRGNTFKQLVRQIFC